MVGTIRIVAPSTADFDWALWPWRHYHAPAKLVSRPQTAFWQIAICSGRVTGYSDEARIRVTRALSRVRGSVGTGRRSRKSVPQRRQGASVRVETFRWMLPVRPSTRFETRPPLRPDRPDPGWRLNAAVLSRLVPSASDRLGTSQPQCLPACPDCPELSRAKTSGVAVHLSSLGRKFTHAC